MRVVQLDRAFGLENLAIAERPEPTAGPDELVLRIEAASLNYRDLLMVRGRYNPRQALPLIPCSDGVGEVVDVGGAVAGIEMGDRVAPIFAQSWQHGTPGAKELHSTLGGPLDGVLAELVAVPAASVVGVPEHLSDVEAATLPCAALTAWSALVTHGRVGPGDAVLTLGTGGVSLFALQFAKLLGARVAITSSSEEKLARAIELGADRGIHVPSEPRWGRLARDWAGGEGVDHVIEVGGAGTLSQSLSAVRPGGTISLIGVLAGGKEELNLLPILMRNVRVQGVFVGSRAAFAAMNRAIAAHRLRPVIDRVFPLEAVRDAMERMALGRHFGKIAIELSR